MTDILTTTLLRFLSSAAELRAKQDELRESAASTNALLEALEKQLKEEDEALKILQQENRS